MMLKMRRLRLRFFRAFFCTLASLQSSHHLPGIKNYEMAFLRSLLELAALKMTFYEQCRVISKRKLTFLPNWLASTVGTGSDLWLPVLYDLLIDYWWGQQGSWRSKRGFRENVPPRAISTLLTCIEDKLWSQFSICHLLSTLPLSVSRCATYRHKRWRYYILLPRIHHRRRHRCYYCWRIDDGKYCCLSSQ